MNDAHIVSAVRTAVGKAFKGSLRNICPDPLLTDRRLLQCVLNKSSKRS